jgi:hypothetical protein
MTTLNKLRIFRDAVALEAFSAQDVAGYFKDVFPGIVRSFKDFTVNFHPTQVGLVLNPQYRNFQRDLPKYTYVDVSPMNAYVPEGLKTTYLEYMAALQDAVGHAVHIMDVLTPYSTYLSQVITNQDMAISTQSFELEFKQLQKERLDLNEKLGACFLKGSTQTDVAVSDVVRRNADWIDVFAQANDIVDAMNRVNRTIILKKVAECDTHLAVLLRMVESKKTDKLSSQMVGNLADGAFQVASELEFYAATHYKTEVLMAAINRTVDHFQTTMNR